MTGHEIERYQSGGELTASNLDSWVAVMTDVCKLAGYIADTSFVPDSLRGNAPAVAAAILTGREMGVPPMTSLANIHVVKGKPGQSALLMRGLVQAAGHEIRDVEATDARCVIEGRRRGEDAWTRVVYTADQARTAKIDLGHYPQDKLYARATTRLCRRKFADVIAGLAYSVDELEDLPERAVAAPVQAPDVDPPRRTAKRKTKATQPPVEEPQPAEPRKSTEDTAPAGPPLPDEIEQATAQDAEPEIARQPALASSAQLAKLHAFFTEHDITDRDQKLRIARALIGRADLQSSTDLTRREASQLIDALAQLDAQTDANDFVRAIELLVSELGARVVDDTPNDDDQETTP